MWWTISIDTVFLIIENIYREQYNCNKNNWDWKGDTKKFLFVQRDKK